MYSVNSKVLIIGFVTIVDPQPLSNDFPELTIHTSSLARFSVRQGTVLSQVCRVKTGVSPGLRGSYPRTVRHPGRDLDQWITDFSEKIGSFLSRYPTSFIEVEKVLCRTTDHTSVFRHVEMTVEQIPFYSEEDWRPGNPLGSFCMSGTEEPRTESLTSPPRPQSRRPHVTKGSEGPTKVSTWSRVEGYPLAVYPSIGRQPCSCRVKQFETHRDSSQRSLTGKTTFCVEVDNGNRRRRPHLHEES